MSNSANDLKSYVSRLENLHEQRDAISADIRLVYGELGNDGFDKKAMRKLLARRKKPRAEVENEDGILETYESQL